MMGLIESIGALAIAVAILLKLSLWLAANF